MFTPTYVYLSFSAGRLSYQVDKERKELRVSVSDMLEDHNYHLRLCHKDFICVGTGASTLVSPLAYWKLSQGHLTHVYETFSQKQCKKNTRTPQQIVMVIIEYTCYTCYS